MQKCRKCGSMEMLLRPNEKNPRATDLYCAKCGAWQKFANKDDIRLYSFKGDVDSLTMENLHTIMECLEIILEFEQGRGDFAARIRDSYRKVENIMEEYI